MLVELLIPMPLELFVVGVAAVDGVAAAGVVAVGVVEVSVVED